GKPGHKGHWALRDSGGHFWQWDVCLPMVQVCRVSQEGRDLRAPPAPIGLDKGCIVRVCYRIYVEIKGGHRRRLLHSRSFAQGSRDPSDDQPHARRWLCSLTCGRCCPGGPPCPQETAALQGDQENCVYLQLPN